MGDKIMDGKIKAEWDKLRKVITHRPGIEMFIGLLEPYASLYERAFNATEARIEHDRLEHVLKYDYKVEVLHLEDLILKKVDDDPEIRKKIIDRTKELIKYSGDPQEVELAKKEFEKNEDVLDAEFYFNILMLNPLIDVEKGKGTRYINLNVTEREPTVNLYFMRDQQATTDKGMFISRMAKPQRRGEPNITQFLWEILDVPIAHRVEEPGTFEGGDFIPMKDFALVGLGDRTNQSGVDQLLKFGVDFDEVAVVHQPNHPLIPDENPDPMIDMHIDTYFDVASSSVAIGLELLLKRAIVEIYYRESAGVYKKDKSETNLHAYMKSKGFNIIGLTTLEQLSYASNFLCVRDGTIIAVDGSRVIKNTLESLKLKANDEPKRYGRLLDQAMKDYQHLKNEGEFFPHKREIYQYGIERSEERR